MKSARVLTNETCNQNCTFCSTRRSEERRSFVRRAAVEERIRAAAQSGAVELTLSGGEPTLRNDLELLIVGAKQRGFQSLVLETNAAALTSERAETLARAGLDRARVKLAGWGEHSDRITQDPGGFAATLAGMGALAAAGIRLEPVLSLVRANAEQAPLVPVHLAESGLPLEALVIAVVLEAPDDQQLLQLGEAAAVVERVAAAARRAGIAARLDPSASIPPCVFREPARVAHLYAFGPGGGRRGGLVHVATCATCAVADRCPGVAEAALARSPATRFTPIEDQRVRRRLSVVESPAEQVERELVSHELCRLPDGSAFPVRTVRVNFHCNQTCHFCFVSTHLPAASEARVREAIEEAGRAGAILALSGGEPTLNPRLLDYVALGRASGAREIELQTNATRLGDDDLACRLAAAGLDVAFVSLHGATAEISDAVTNAPGTFERTQRGIDAALAAALRVRLNFVFCELNRQAFPDVVRLVAERWPAAELAVSFVAPSTDLVPRERWLIPRYTEVLPSLVEGVRIARQRGVSLTGFESMCGIPLCLVPAELDQHLGLAEVPPGLDGGEFVKPDPCDACALSVRCWGLRRGYAELHGAGELRPVARSG